MSRVRERSHAGGLRTWHFGFDGPDLLAATTTRHGGVGTGPYAGLNLAFHVGDDPEVVATNRDLLCRALGLAALTVPDQQHGSRVAVVDRSLAGAGHRPDQGAEERLAAIDGLVTDRPGIAVGILMADCGPVVLYDPVQRALGVAHAGRRGVVLDVLGATVQAMTDRFGSHPADLLAGVGPCIAQASYEIGGASLEETRVALGDDLLRPSRPGHATFDLPGAIRRRLVGAGVPGSRIEVAGVDTYRSTDDLFSDRACRPCGRMMLVATLR